MIWKKLVRFFRRKPDGNGSAAKRAAAEAERRLDAAKQMWPQTRETRDLLAAWIEDALRGQR